MINKHAFYNHKMKFSHSKLLPDALKKYEKIEFPISKEIFPVKQHQQKLIKESTMKISLARLKLCFWVIPMQLQFPYVKNFHAMNFILHIISWNSFLLLLSSSVNSIWCSTIRLTCDVYLWWKLLYQSNIIVT